MNAKQQPTTVEEKLRLVIESESDELIPLSERRRDRQLTEDERSETEATGALRYLSEVGDAINLSNDVGVRLRFPTDAFWRVTADKTWQLDDDWALEAEQRLYYFHQDGWGARSAIGVGRDLGNGWDFLSASELEWIHDDRKFEMAQTFNFFKRLNNRATLNPRLGILGESQPTWRQTNTTGWPTTSTKASTSISSWPPPRNNWAYVSPWPLNISCKACPTPQLATTTMISTIV